MCYFSVLISRPLHRYTDIFVRHEIDLPTFATLTDEELKEVGTGHLDFMAS